MNFDILAPVLALAACAWLLWRRRMPLRQARRMQGKRVQIPGSPDLAASLYYFWSPHCGLCRGMNQLVDQTSSAVTTSTRPRKRRLNSSRRR